MTPSWTRFFAVLGGGLVAALVLVVAVEATLRLLRRRWTLADAMTVSGRHPFRTLVVVLAIHVAVRFRPAGAAGWWDALERATQIVFILAAGWMVGAVLLFLEDLGLRRYRIDVPDNRTARRLRTQVLIIRRLTIGAVVVLAFGAVLLTFPAVRAVGTSVLASAGLISVIAGLAAQSTLSNVFAGVQLAFSDAMRIDDAVIVEDEWGWVEEITLTYVVVRLWDDRRLILPSTYFSSTPFQNWTRRTSELLGSVELDLDWRIDTTRMRKELDRILAGTELWDGRVQVLQVTDAVGGWVRVRVLVTAKDAPTLFDLRCLVREQLIGWVQQHDPDGMPRLRTELVESRSAPRRAAARQQAPGLFTGDPDAEERAARAGGGH